MINGEFYARFILKDLIFGGPLTARELNRILLNDLWRFKHSLSDHKQAVNLSKKIDYENEKIYSLYKYL